MGKKTEEKKAALLAAAQTEMEQWGSRRIMLSLDIVQATIFAAAIQLALRHPGFSRTPSAGEARGFVKTIESHIPAEFPHLRELIRLGNDPAFDSEIRDGFREIAITIKVSEIVFGLLEVLGLGADGISPKEVIQRLIDHAQQGVYRPGAWERTWLESVFGDNFTNYLEPGDPYGRPGLEGTFQRPSQAARQMAAERSR